MEWYPAFLATINAFLVANRTDSSEGIHKWPIPATCMMPLRGKRPAPVKTACPRASVLYFRSSQNGATPDFFLIAPETPWGNNNHHGIRLRFHALTMTSTFWSRRSPVMIFGFIFSWLTSALCGGAVATYAAGHCWPRVHYPIFIITHTTSHAKVSDPPAAINITDRQPFPLGCRGGVRCKTGTDSPSFSNSGVTA